VLDCARTLDDRCEVVPLGDVRFLSPVANPGKIVAAPVGELPDASRRGAARRLDLQIAVNGEVRQQANTKDLILSVPELIEFASSFYTLYPGDIILTGTPAGVGPTKPGDVLAACIQRIGAMEVRVRAA
jgi:2-keto-4-pentenoate hydratase/2-oxohepta-3-ene-1,7-dioic acid hydratase in catechol pathway